MVSGVGPKATLSKVGIDVVSDLPGVGQNMMVRLRASRCLFYQCLTMEIK